MRTVLVLMLSALAAICLSCGSDGDRGKANDSPLTPEQVESAQRMVDGPAQLAQLAADPEDGETVQGLFDLNSDLNNLIAYGMQSKYETRKSPLVETQRMPIDANCYKVEANKVIFDHCEEGGLVIDGWITNADNVITCDISIQGTFSGTDIDMSYKGSITTTDNMLDGEMEIRMTVESGESMIDYTLTADYQQIALSDGCPTDGKLVVTANYSSMGTNYNFTVELDFGPACGDVKATTV